MNESRMSDRSGTCTDKDGIEGVRASCRGDANSSLLSRRRAATRDQSDASSPAASAEPNPKLLSLSEIFVNRINAAAATTDVQSGLSDARSAQEKARGVVSGQLQADHADEKAAVGIPYNALSTGPRPILPLPPVAKSKASAREENGSGSFEAAAAEDGGSQVHSSKLQHRASNPWDAHTPAEEELFRDKKTSVGYAINVDALTRLKRLFDAADSDGSDGLEMEEFVSAFGSVLGDNLSRQQLTHMFMKARARCSN